MNKNTNLHMTLLPYWHLLTIMRAALSLGRARGRLLEYMSAKLEDKEKK
jgi:hypothetical protein